MNMKSSFNCQTLNCNGWCEALTGAETFRCYFCKRKNCIPCKAIHENVSCEEYKRQLKMALDPKNKDSERKIKVSK